MNTSTYNQEIILLFDEQGTPTFNPEREADSFLGIGVAYDLTNEEHLFTKCDVLFGLSNRKHLKNNRIGNSRAIEISKLIVNLPIQVIVKSIDLTNENFQQVVNLYEDLGNIMRKMHRNVSERPTPQILHTHILDHILFNSITKYIENNTTNSNFSVYIDDWSIPENDLQIELKIRSKSLEKKINDLYKFAENLVITVSPITMLNQDCSRKRFVDVIASVVSRSFLKKENQRFSNIPLQNIFNQQNNHNELVDITKDIIVFMRKFMNNDLRNL